MKSLPLMGPVPVVRMMDGRVTVTAEPDNVAGAIRRTEPPLAADRVDIGVVEDRTS
jgi:hypothetical protein